MLKIRPEHLTALAAQEATGFVARMRLHLREVFPEEVAGLDDSKLNVFIEKICAQGEQWGITKEPLVERLIELFVSFDQLRRNPLPQWIGSVVRHSGRDGVRLLLRLENGLQFGEGRTMSAEPDQAFVAATYYRRVDESFYSKVQQENGGTLPADLQDSDGQARPLTMSPLDRAYRREWKALAAQMRNSRAIPKKSLKSASTPWLARASSVKFAPVLLPSKNGATTKVAIKPPRFS